MPVKRTRGFTLVVSSPEGVENSTRKKKEENIRVRFLAFNMHVADRGGMRGSRKERRTSCARGNRANVMPRESVTRDRLNEPPPARRRTRLVLSDCYCCCFFDGRFSPRRLSSPSVPFLGRARVFIFIFYFCRRGGPQMRGPVPPCFLC